MLVDAPIRTGYLQGLAGVSALSGAFARAELGIRPTDKLAAYLFGEWNQTNPYAGIGARWMFDF